MTARFLGIRAPLVAAVHLDPLPGSPRFGGDMRAVIRRAAAAADLLAAEGFDALLVENFGDAPFYKDGVPPETVAALTAAAAAVRDAAPGVPLGINCLRNDARAALGVAAAMGARFIRVNVHTGAAVTDQGVVEGRAAATLRARDRIAPGVAIAADVHVKHARPLAPVPLDEAVRDTVERGLADAVIVTGDRSGAAACLDDVRIARAAAAGVPVLVGSGVTKQNVDAVLAAADGVIVGSALERGGRTGAPLDRRRVRAFVAKARGAGAS